VSKDLFEADDPLEHPLWRKAEMLAAAPPRPGPGYITVNLVWLARVWPVARSVDQLVVLMLLYRQCVMKKSNTVSLPNGEVAALGISRYTKYRLLARLQSAGAATVTTTNGRAALVTLHWFP
jgi:hypothetical protein